MENQSPVCYKHVHITDLTTWGKTLSWQKPVDIPPMLGNQLMQLALKKIQTRLFFTWEKSQENQMRNIQAHHHVHKICEKRKEQLIVPIVLM